MFGNELYQQREDLTQILSWLTYMPNKGTFAMAKNKIKSWLEKTNLEIRQFENNMGDAAEEHFSMKLIEFGGMKN